MKRSIQPLIRQDLAQKMVLLGGPRQVGKTTIARRIAEQVDEQYLYLNWDNDLHRKQIMAQRFNPDSKVIVFDEIHKYPDWKNYLKGVYDTYHHRYQLLVTGSARLDVYRKGGDSMMGRYFFSRLHPLSISEILQLPLPNEWADKLTFRPKREALSALEKLKMFGGFPESYLVPDRKPQYSACPAGKSAFSC